MDASSGPRLGESKQSDGFTTLPDEIKNYTARFLCAKDALCLASTCKQVHESMALSCLQPVLSIESADWYGSGGECEAVKGYPIPVLFPTRIHSVGITLRWRDQGWGYRKGQIYVVATTPESDQPTAKSSSNSTSIPNPHQFSFDGGRLVYESPYADHTDEPLSFEFSPRPHEVYHLWAKAGGGGGHELMIRNVHVHMLVHSDFGRDLCRNFAALNSRGILEIRPLGPQKWQKLQPQPLALHPLPPVNKFCMELLMNVATSLRKQQEEKIQPVDQTLATFLATYGIQATPGSLAAVAEIATTMLEDIPLSDDIETHDAERGFGMAGNFDDDFEDGEAERGFRMADDLDDDFEDDEDEV